MLFPYCMLGADSVVGKSIICMKSYAEGWLFHNELSTVCLLSQYNCSFQTSQCFAGLYGNSTY